ncbi:hypothetical protein CHUAL_011622 [Chamberlinius hualienensis]
MGERKGTNKYYPPDYDPKKGSLNKFKGTHALRERARKLDQGILIIRFEMPYNIWCDGCGNHIGMGVRYNAEKKKVGMYYTTPLWQFRMKCHLCDNHFEMKTDPQNLDYVIVSGARRQERRWDPTQNGQVVPEDKQTSNRLADDAMFKLEHGVDDQRKSSLIAPTIAQLEDLQYRLKDDYMANKLLRTSFRVKKKEMAKKAEIDRALLTKSSLDIQLVPEDPKDVQLASLIRLTPLESFDDRQKNKRDEIEHQTIFNKSKQLDVDLKRINKGINEAPGSSKKNLSALNFGVILKQNKQPATDESVCNPSSTNNLVPYSYDTSESDNSN